MKQTHLLVLCAIIAIAGCKSVSPSPPLAPPPVPMNSAVMLPKGSTVLLGQEVYSRLKSTITNKYSCKQFSIDSVEKTGGSEDLAIDGSGKLWKGTIAEMWHLTVCGTQKNFGVVVTPDGHGGAFVAIAE